MKLPAALKPQTPYSVVMTCAFRGRSRWSALLLAALALALTGCLRVQLTFTVHDDGSGTVSTLMAVDETLLALTGESADDILGEVGDLPEGAVVEAYEEDGFVGQFVTVSIPDMARAAEFLGGVDAAAGSTDELSLVREGEGWRFTMAIPSGEELAGDSGDIDLAGALGEDAFFRVRVALPGEVVEHNADWVEDGMLVWEIDWTSSEPRTLSALSQPGSGGSTDIGFVAVLAGLAALAVFGFFAFHSRGASP